MHAESVLKLTRWILRFANQGDPRSNFLEEISRMLLDFSNCDELEILHWDGNLTYRWRKNREPDPESCFQVLPDTVNGSLLVLDDESSCLDRLYRLVLISNYDEETIHTTRKGSFWTNDLYNLPDNLLKDAKIETDTPSGEWGKYRSMIILPFTLDINNTGLLVLKHKHRGFFTRYEIQFYEGITQTVGLATADRSAQAALRERVKELTCLYGIARISNKQDLSLDEKLKNIVDLLPPAWQYPDITVARIVLHDNSYSTKAYRPGRHRLFSKIIVNDQAFGFVEVIYIDNKPEFTEYPFLEEEVSLIEEIARQVGTIVEKFETEMDKIRLQEQLRHADRLATIGQLAAGVAHELNEPLGGILGFAQLAQKSLGNIPASKTTASLGKDLQKIEKSSLYARQIIREMLIFARQMPTRKATVNLNKIIEEVSSFFESRCKNEGIHFHLDLYESLPRIDADPAQINQLLINLSVNAIHAMAKGGRLTVRTYVDEDFVIMIVKDNGVGMSKKTCEQIFNPFFTTKDVNQGTGLGLSVVHGIVNSHNGTIEVDSIEGIGTTFKVRLPFANQQIKTED